LDGTQVEEMQETFERFQQWGRSDEEKVSQNTSKASQTFAIYICHDFKDKQIAVAALGNNV
jgi:hypothetical protein